MKHRCSYQPFGGMNCCASIFNIFTSRNKNVLFTVLLYLHQKGLVASDTVFNVQHGFFFKLLAGVVSTNHTAHFLPP